VIREQGIDYYRHDFNVEPLIFWRANDAPDRQGVTEIKYVTGFLAFYDELLRRNPAMLIDNCAREAAATTSRPCAARCRC